MLGSLGPEIIKMFLKINLGWMLSNWPIAFKLILMVGQIFLHSFTHLITPTQTLVVTLKMYSKP